MKISKRRICLNILLIILSNSIRAQFSCQNDSTFELTPKIENKQPISPLNQQKLHLSLEVSAGVIGSKYFSGSYTSLNSSFNYLLSPKFKIEVGAIYSTGYYNFYRLPAESSFKSQQKTDQLLVYTRGQYMLTDKLIFSGILFKTLNTNTSQQINPYFLDYKGMSLGVDYKVNEHLSFGAQFNFLNLSNNNFFYQGGSGFFPVRQGLGW